MKVADLHDTSNVRFDPPTTHNWSYGDGVMGDLDSSLDSA